MKPQDSSTQFFFSEKAKRPIWHAAAIKPTMIKTKKVLHLIVESASSLQSVAYWGKQDPYVSASTGPDRAITKRTAAHKEGDTDPKWDHTLRNHMVLDLTQEATCSELVVELFAEGVASDDLIGSTTLELPEGWTSFLEGAAVTKELKIDTGGTLKLKFYFEISKFKTNARSVLAAAAMKVRMGGGLKGPDKELQKLPVIQARRLCFTIRSCGQLQDVQSLSAQDPYVVAFLMPQKAETQRTSAVAAGGTDPKWGASEGEGVLEELMLAWPEGDSSSMLLEVWNENEVLEDDFIGSTMVRLVGDVSEAGSTKKYELNTGGWVEMTMRTVLEEEYQQGMLVVDVHQAKDLRNVQRIGDQVRM
jgi:Ca2+-dependent lipid-binding protein